MGWGQEERDEVSCSFQAELEAGADQGWTMKQG